MQRWKNRSESSKAAELCKDFDVIPTLADAAEEQAMLNDYAAKTKKPEGVEYSVAVKALCKDCRRAYIQIIHVEVVEGRRNESITQA